MKRVRVSKRIGRLWVIAILGKQVRRKLFGSLGGWTKQEG